MRSRTGGLFIFFFAAMVCSPQNLPVNLDPKILTFKRLADLPWNNAGRVQQIVLYGDPTKPGFYSVILKWPPGTGSRPHTHPNDRFVTVLSGTWWVGTGSDYDMSKTVPMRAGSFVTHTAGGVHFDGAKDEEAIVLVSGMGPATTVNVQTK
ncbi:MAG TPA: cupin domain-containing protein [Blastocatellia bacterium]